MSTARLAALALAALVVAACGGGSSLPTPGITAAPSAGGSPAAAASRVEVQLTDGFQIKLSADRVPVGTPVTFVITNIGAIEHEFYLGDEAAQAEHEKEMAAGGMPHDEPMGVAVKPGETRELTVTFDAAGTILAGCHLPGHYPAGMKATITVG